MGTAIIFDVGWAEFPQLNKVCHAAQGSLLGQAQPIQIKSSNCGAGSVNDRWGDLSQEIATNSIKVPLSTLLKDS